MALDHAPRAPADGLREGELSAHRLPAGPQYSAAWRSLREGEVLFRTQAMHAVFGVLRPCFKPHGLVLNREPHVPPLSSLAGTLVDDLR